MCPLYAPLLRGVASHCIDAAASSTELVDSCCCCSAARVRVRVRVRVRAMARGRSIYPHRNTHARQGRQACDLMEVRGT